MKNVNVLAVRLPNWVGDVVMATPALKVLRERFVEAKMVGVMRPGARKIVGEGPWFDEVVAVDDHGLRGLSRLTREIKRLRPDLAVLMPNSIRSAVPFWLAGVPQRVGYRRRGRGWLITGGPTPQRDNRRFTPLPMHSYYLELCRWLGCTIDADARPQLYISPQTQQHAEELLKCYGVRQNDIVIGLNPGANFGSSKCWPPEHFARLAELLASNFDAKIMLFSGPGEEAIAHAILHESQSYIIDTTPDHVDLELLKPMIRRCNLLVTNDTGPRHYAVAFDVPVVVIMGPTDPGWTQVFMERTRVVRIDVPCAPCHKKTCPTDHRCMKDITPEMVLAAARELMETVTLSSSLCSRINSAKGLS
ncbi:MAG: lipopolysaccharide heptosyltransferase II [Sedimentisphaerales bacterium]|nr:lipopolysaccharide heptosyltransferase II [Sedimentisphaerales bacterium]